MLATDLTRPDPIQPDSTRPDPTRPHPTRPYPTQPNPTQPTLDAPECDKTGDGEEDGYGFGGDIGGVCGAPYSHADQPVTEDASVERLRFVPWIMN